MDALDTLKPPKWYLMQELGTVALFAALGSAVWVTLKPSDW